MVCLGVLFMLCRRASRRGEFRLHHGNQKRTERVWPGLTCRSLSNRTEHSQIVKPAACSYTATVHLSMPLRCRIAVVAALSSARLGKGAEQETFVRPNVNECGAQTNFLAYAATLGDVVQCQGPECDYQVGQPRSAPA